MHGSTLAIYDMLHLLDDECNMTAIEILCDFLHDLRLV